MIMNENLRDSLLLSIAFSVFGMLLIFGLGFIFPTVNPYVVIKWIVIVAGVVFVVSFLKYVFYIGTWIMAWRKTKGKKSAKK